MLQSGNPKEVISDSFSAELAQILYGTPANPDREALEASIVERFEAAVRGMDRKQIWRLHLHIDENIVPLLSGKNLLRVAQIMESRAPTVIDGMKNLRKHKEHLRRSAKLAEILSPRALERLIRALKESKKDEKNEGVQE